MKIFITGLVLLSSAGFALGAPHDATETPPAAAVTIPGTQEIPLNLMPHSAYSGFGAYGGLGFAGPFHGRPLHGIRQGLRCVGTELKLTETLNQTMRDCHDKVYTDWETSGKIGDPPIETRACGIVCTAQGIGLLNKYGRPNNDVIAEHIEKVYPAEVKADLTAAIIDCGKKHGQEVTIKDGSCASFEQLIGCVKSNVRRICNGPPPNTVTV